MMTGPAATTTALPVRVARANGTCPLCPWPIQAGQNIVKHPGRAWSHEKCPTSASGAYRRRGRDA